MSDLIETIKESTKDVPTWVWFVGGGVVLVVFVVLARSRGAGQYIPASSTENPPSSPPGLPPASTSQAPLGDATALEEAFTGLAGYFAGITSDIRRQQATLATAQQEQQAALGSLGYTIAGLKSDVGQLGDTLDSLPALIESATSALVADRRSSAETLSSLTATQAGAGSAAAMITQQAAGNSGETASPAQVNPSTPGVATSQATNPLPTRFVETPSLVVQKSEAAAAPVTTTLNVWQDSDTAAGYVPTTVTVDPTSIYETEILKAKAAYEEAEKAGDTLQMQAAESVATMYRRGAADAGVQLPEWTKSGKELPATPPPTTQSKFSYNPFGPTPI